MSKTFEEDVTLDLMPDSGMYEAVSRVGYTRNDALREFIDNALDEYGKALYDGRKIKKPTVRVIFDFDNKDIAVEDNMGGIPHDRVEDCLKPGRMNASKLDTIGYFALGLKAGGLSLGDFVMATMPKGEKLGTSVYLKKDKLVSEARKTLAKRINGHYIVPAGPDGGTKRKVPKGTTVFHFVNLKDKHKDFTVDDVAKFAREIGEYHGILCTNRYADVKIIVEVRSSDPGVEAKEIPVVFKTLDDFKAQFVGNDFCPIPELHYIDTQKMTKDEVEDIVDMTAREVDGSTAIELDKDVYLRAIVGVAWISRPALDYGADVYMNDRMISKYDKITFGDMAAKPHHSLSRLRAMLFISGPASKTPSNFSKNGLDESNPLYFKLVRAMNQLYSKYRALLKRWGEDLGPVLSQHADVIREVRELTPHADLEMVRVPTTSEGDAPVRKRKAYTRALKSGILADWKKRPEMKDVVTYATKNFDLKGRSEPQRRKVRGPIRKKKTEDRLSVRKDDRFSKLFDKAKEKYKKTARANNPTDKSVITAALKVYTEG